MICRLVFSCSLLCLGGCYCLLCLGLYSVLGGSVLVPLDSNFAWFRFDLFVGGVECWLFVVVLLVVIPFRALVGWV